MLIGGMSAESCSSRSMNASRSREAMRRERPMRTERRLPRRQVLVEVRSPDREPARGFVDGEQQLVGILWISHRRPSLLMCGVQSEAAARQFDVVRAELDPDRSPAEPSRNGERRARACERIDHGGWDWIDAAVAVWGARPRLRQDAPDAFGSPGLSCRRSSERGPFERRFPGLAYRVQTCRCQARPHLGQQPAALVPARMQGSTNRSGKVAKWASW